jgi:acyl-CoA thioesterase
MTTYRELFQTDQYAKLSGIELVSVTPGHAVARMPVQPCHLNALGVVQGGAIFTLADLAFGAACNSRGLVALAINASITFMKAVTTGTLTAEVRELSFNPKLGAYTVNITDEQNNLVAVFQGLAYRKKQAHDAVNEPA